MSWGQFLGKISEYIQGRDERRRNELDKLYKQKKEIESETQTTANTVRLERILDRIGVLEKLNKNK